jgi:hypothetical protein
MSKQLITEESVSKHALPKLRVATELLLHASLQQ